MNTSTNAYEFGKAARDWDAEVRQIMRRNELTFRWFVAAGVLVCGLVLAAMFLS